MKKIKVGILYNSRENLFSEYLAWIVSQSKNSDIFEISAILINDLSLADTTLIKDEKLNVTFDEVVENSDVVFSLGYWRIIKRKDIQRVRLGIVNFHNSFNLMYKGRHSSTWVLRNKEKYHGCTMHFIDENVDEGTIIDTRKFKIEEIDTAEDIFVKATNLGLQILKDNFYSVLSKNYKSYELKNEKTYTYRKKDLSHEIDLEVIKKPQDLLRLVRALTFSNKPSPYIIINNQKIYLKLDGYDGGILSEKRKF